MWASHGFGRAQSMPRVQGRNRPKPRDRRHRKETCAPRGCDCARGREELHIAGHTVWKSSTASLTRMKSLWFAHFTACGLPPSTKKRGPFADEEAGPEIPDTRGRGTQFGKGSSRRRAFAFPVGRARCSAVRHPELRNAGRRTGLSSRERRASKEVLTSPVAETGHSGPSSQ